MSVLFLISVLCFFAIFVAALAVARHVRVQRLRSPYLQVSDANPTTPTPPQHATIAPLTDQSLRELIERKEPDWRFLVSENRRSQKKAAAQIPPKPSTSTKLNVQRRRDWTYLEEHLGDLSDPYGPQTSHLARTGSKLT